MIPLSRSQKEFLGLIARKAVADAADGAPPPSVEELAQQEGVSLEGILMEKRGAFVTLTAQKRLRGCIGYIEGVKPLAWAVADNARSAAVRDPRFPPLTREDLPGLDLEISVLTPLRRIASPEEIEIGRHGVLMGKNGRQAVFLPQVATEQGWDRDTTLTQLSLKAGLDPGAWRSGAWFKVFEALVFRVVDY